MKEIKTSYFDFLKKSRNRNGTELPEVNDLIEQFNRESISNHFFPHVFYFSDYIQNTNYFRPFSSRYFLGYTSEFLLKTDALFFNRMRDQKDMEIFDEQIFPDQMAFLANHKGDKNVEYTFITNFRLKNYSDTWSSLVQRTHYLFNDHSIMPVASINSLTDFTYLKNDLTINHLIEKCEECHEKTVIESKCYYPNNKSDIFSKREVDVLKLASQGMGSKQIADQLNISIHTINNHRRNMLVRSNCKNFLQLVDIAVKSGVL
ncbi:transcriptional regulator, LuxR family protein [Arcticibacter svalbardensis MN12-7]|uniref:Transcriptional regulator, LuxR family protein n=1 Tax=Arcticibacter svalbardensis MN12-7 TaxID=1150600 RepID=R9GRZ1_9SPHI|nr:helix-turn-helix transcriptional regulator [Arcticibacter svalbardensis]EOR94491.1 transcriptional regulator, LuxR family protein [Arcticibacter svalbardensis MN12-7]